MQDLIEGIHPIEASRVTEEEAWEIYKTMDDFANMAFKTFKEHLRNHRKQVGENQVRQQRSQMPLNMTEACFQGRQ
jgi:hypothetical protein